MLTVDIIKVIPRYKINPRCASFISILPPEVEANQDRANLAIKQHCHPFLSKIMQDALEKKIVEGTSWTVREAEFKMVNHILLGRNKSKGEEESYRPVLPTLKILPELVNSHHRVNHRGYQFCLEDLSSRFYNK